jgi:hypothetical protein
VGSQILVITAGGHTGHFEADSARNLVRVLDLGTK